jgi:hypothetical protein
MSELDDFFAKQYGFNSTAEYKLAMEFNSHITTESKKYYDLPPEQWPEIKFNWNFNLDEQRYSFDGMKQQQFCECCPNGLLLGLIDLKTFDQHLCHYSRRDEGELWELGSKSKLAEMIVYLSEGHPIAPPAIKPISTSEVIFIGGHHRYAVAKAIEVDEIPLHVPPEFKTEIESIFKINWHKPNK